jgi:hypothetical protein
VRAFFFVSRLIDSRKFFSLPFSLFSTLLLDIHLALHTHNAHLFFSQKAQLREHVFYQLMGRSTRDPGTGATVQPKDTEEKAELARRHAKLATDVEEGRKILDTMATDAAKAAFSKRVSHLVCGCSKFFSLCLFLTMACRFIETGRGLLGIGIVLKDGIVQPDTATDPDKQPAGEPDDQPAKPKPKAKPKAKPTYTVITSLVEKVHLMCSHIGPMRMHVEGQEGQEGRGQLFWQSGAVRAM